MGNDPELNVAFAEAMAPLYDKYKNLDNSHLRRGSDELKAWQLWDKNTATGQITPADDNTLLLVKIMEEAFESSDEARCTLHCATCIAMLWNSPLPRKGLPAKTSRERGCPVLAIWYTCHRT